MPEKIFHLETKLLDDFAVLKSSEKLQSEDHKQEDLHGKLDLSSKIYEHNWFIKSRLSDYHVNYDSSIFTVLIHKI